TTPLTGHPNFEGISAIIFSGGVSEYVYEHDRTAYGDLGPLFGKYIREELSRIGRTDLVHEAAEGIRATVIGAGEYTIQASGTTARSWTWTAWTWATWSTSTSAARWAPRKSCPSP